MWEEMRGDERNEVERYRGRERESVGLLLMQARMMRSGGKKNTCIYSSLIGEVANPHTSTYIFAFTYKRSGESAHFVMQQNERKENVNHTHYQQPKEHKIWHQDGVC